MQAGTFKARVIDVELGYTDSGNEQVALLFETQTGETISWYGTFTEKATPYTIKDLRACGWTGNDLATLGVEDLASDVEIVVEEDMYNGKSRLKVKWINGANRLNVKNRMTPAQKAAFGVKLKGAIMAVPAPRQTPVPAQQDAFNPDDF